MFYHASDHVDPTPFANIDNVVNIALCLLDHPSCSGANGTANRMRDSCDSKCASRLLFYAPMAYGLGRLFNSQHNNQVFTLTIASTNVLGS
jgi:hypothetical protein